eukprot:872553-Pyramimonas_sp.AAC.1
MQCLANADGKLEGVSKVKAHLTEDPSLPWEEIFNIRGNNFADEAAKAGANLHQPLDDSLND